MALSKILPASQAQYVGARNLIINGNVTCSQRNGTSSVTPSNSYTLDRFGTNTSQASKFTVQQDTTAPVDFVNSLKATSSSAYTVGSGDVFTVYQNIEGQNISHLNWGSANAQTVTLSFKVRSSLTGIFGGAIVNSAQDRSYPFTYTISTADAWTDVSITVAGDTSGTWLTTNGIGIRVRFNLGAGSTYSGSAGAWASANYFSATGATSVVGTSGATWYITGIQLEVGSATPFEHEPFSVTLQKCQRYYCTTGTSAGYSVPTNIGPYGYMLAPMSFPVEMRSAPSMTNTSFANAGTGSYHGGFQSITTYRYVHEMRNSGGSNLYGQTINTADAEL
jgi:hypothetical protein